MISVHYISHLYIASVFSRRLRMLKPHRIVSDGGFEYIVFDLTSDGYEKDLIFMVLYDHKFNPDIYDSVVSPGCKVTKAQCRDSVEATVNLLIKDLKTLNSISIPYTRF